MADLRGNEIKDSYQNVVTDSGSDLNGIQNGNGADITGRVVSRGSNSNGELVRFADGTQICTNNITLTYDRAEVLIGDWSFPVNFNSPPSLSVQVDFVGTDGSRSRRSYHSSLIVNSLLADRIYYYDPSASWVTGDERVCRLLAIGTWK